jgi:Ca2+-binding EF-hand superfamily protein
MASAAAVYASQEPGRQGGRGGFPPMRSPIAAALDANQDNTISSAEIDNAPAALKTLDKNNDGHLRGDELMPAMMPGRGREGMGMPMGEGRGGNPDEPGETPATSPDELASMLMTFDKNKDGQLTKSELPERLQGLFDRADANRDGKITPAEIKASAGRTRQLNELGGREGFGREGGGREGGGREGGRGPGGMDLLMNALDTNKDGMLSGDEIAAAPKSLRTLDRNNDGQLTADEIRPGGRIG